MRLDHIVFCVTDLKRAAAQVADRTGLVAVAGGRHAGHGTENVIVPLGDAYLELVTVVDAEVAAASPWGTWVTGRALADLSPAAWCLRTDDLTAVAARIGEPAVAMQRHRPDGVDLAWSVTGLGGALSPLGRPFFIEWHIADELLPGRSTGQHATVDWIEVAMTTWTPGSGRMTSPCAT